MMKKVLLCCALAATLAFAGCGRVEEKNPVEGTDSGKTTAEITVSTPKETDAPETEAPETKAPETKAPETEAPKTEAPKETEAITKAPAETKPEPEVEEWNVPGTVDPMPSKIILSYNGANIEITKDKTAKQVADELHLEAKKEEFSTKIPIKPGAGITIIDGDGPISGCSCWFGNNEDIDCSLLGIKYDTTKEELMNMLGTIKSDGGGSMEDGTQLETYTWYDVKIGEINTNVFVVFAWSDSVPVHVNSALVDFQN